MTYDTLQSAKDLPRSREYHRADSWLDHFQRAPARGPLCLRPGLDNAPVLRESMERGLMGTHPEKIVLILRLA
jgi:hypothetical protein